METIKIGFKGMGKCGKSLACFFRGEGIEITGFSSRHTETDDDFRILTDGELTDKSDVIFITTADDDIYDAWNELCAFDLSEKFIYHCSGSLTSEIFKGANPDKVCSVHPMLAFSSTHTDISGAFFTVEGGEGAIHVIKSILKNNMITQINPADKPLYHAAACFASNFVVSVCEIAETLLAECGFSRQDAHTALSPLMLGNMENIVKCGTHGALTGPASRGDTKTVAAHMNTLSKYPETAKIYESLTKIITDMNKNTRRKI